MLPSGGIIICEPHANQLMSLLRFLIYKNRIYKYLENPTTCVQTPSPVILNFPFISLPIQLMVSIHLSIIIVFQWSYSHSEEKKNQSKLLSNIVDVSLNKIPETVKDTKTRRAAAVHGVTKDWAWLSDWTTHKKTDVSND